MYLQKSIYSNLISFRKNKAPQSTDNDLERHYYSLKQLVRKATAQVWESTVGTEHKPIKTLEAKTFLATRAIDYLKVISCD